MTESDQAQALQAAFPTEPVSDALKQRVANLTPLAPVVTGYKFKFRHAFAAFAVLWIGHNVPVAIKVLGNDDALTTSHIQHFEMKPNPVWQASAKGKNTPILIAESWRKGKLSKLCSFDYIKKESEYVQFTNEGISYKYYPYYFPKTHQVFVTYNQEKPDQTFTRLKIQLISVLPILLLGTHDNRPTERIGDKKLKVSKMDSLTYYSDPSTEKPLEIKMKTSNSESIIKIEYNVSPPDSFFIPKFPKGTQYIVQNPSGKNNVQQYSDLSWETFKSQVRAYTLEQHP